MATMNEENILVSTFAGKGGSAGLQDGDGARFKYPHKICSDRTGNVYVADNGRHSIRMIAIDGKVSTIAGIGSGFTDGDGAKARFSCPMGICVDKDGVVFVADKSNHSIRKVAVDGQVSTVSGHRRSGEFRDGDASHARFNRPEGIAVDRAGNLFVADCWNHRIRKITPTGQVSTIAGSSTPGFKDGHGTDARFHHPCGVCVASGGVILVADCSNHRVRKITPDGEVSTVAGNGHTLFKDGSATEATFNYPYDVVADDTGNVFVADSGNNRVRMIATADGHVSTVAGSGTAGFKDGCGVQAHFNGPRSLTIDVEGNMYVSDYNNHCIRKIVGAVARGAVVSFATSHEGRLSACAARVEEAEKRRVHVLATHTEIVINAHVVMRAVVKEAQSKLERAQDDQLIADEASMTQVTEARAALTKVQEDVATFRTKVATGELDGLDIEDTHELLVLLGVTTVSLSTLQREEINGVVLAGINERDMEKVLHMEKLGDRRRLSMAIRRLANRQGFPESMHGQPGALSWNTDEVVEWLKSERFESLAPSFIDHAIDGVVLLQLGLQDLDTLNITTLGQKISLKNKLQTVKKHTYSGQGVDGSAASSSVCPETSSIGHLQAVLAAVLEENVGLQQRADRKNEAQHAIPPQFLCPILCDVMDDPVIAMDGFTYERAAIETWFQRSDTSPMTNLQIPLILVPNIIVKQLLAELM